MNDKNLEEAREVASKIDLRQFIEPGFVTYTFDKCLPNKVHVTFRSLSTQEIQGITRDVRKYRKGISVPGGELEPGDIPGEEEARTYAAIRELAGHTHSLGDMDFTQMTHEDRVKTLYKMVDNLTGILYAKLQIFKHGVALALSPESGEDPVKKS